MIELKDLTKKFGEQTDTDSTHAHRQSIVVRGVVILKISQDNKKEKIWT